MKITESLLLSALTLGGGSFVYAADSTISITGQVQDNTCVLSTASQDLTVDLMNYPQSQFSEKGAGGALVPFTLVFSQCGSAATAVRVGFTGTADTNNTSLLKIDSGTSSYATGIGIEILDSSENIIPINQSQDNLNWITITGGQQNTVSFYARMVATALPVTAGTVSGSATITLEFE